MGSVPNQKFNEEEFIMLKMKNFPRIVLVALMTVVLLTFWSELSISSSPFTLRIGFFPVQDFLPYFVMMEKGFDKKHGIRFEEISYPGGAAIIDAMNSNTVDVG